MNPATEALEEINEESREPTLAERTHDALQDSGEGEGK